MTNFPLLSIVLLTPLLAAFLICFLSNEAKGAVRVISAGAML